VKIEYDLISSKLYFIQRCFYVFTSIDCIIFYLDCAVCSLKVRKRSNDCAA